MVLDNFVVVEKALKRKQEKGEAKKSKCSEM